MVHCVHLMNDNVHFRLVIVIKPLSDYQARLLIVQQRGGSVPKSP